jgi:glycosyltransferase involved in cell wall biosynthesis
MSVLYSVIMPIYNKEKFLPRSFSSVINQTCNDYELICINDGSSDNSSEVLSGLISGSKINVRVLNQLNQGASSAKNFGCAVARGKYLAFIDADDEWDQEYLAEVKKLITDYPEASAYVTGYTCITHSRQWNVTYDSSDRTGYIRDYFNKRLNRWGVHTSSFVVKRDTFFDIGGFPNLIGSNQRKNAWLIDCNGAILRSFADVELIGDITSVDRFVTKLSSVFDGVDDLSIQLPCVIGEDQFLHDTIATKYCYAFTKKILSKWYGDVPSQITKKNGRTPIFSHYLAMEEISVTTRKMDSLLTKGIKNYIRFLSLSSASFYPLYKRKYFMNVLGRQGILNEIGCKRFFCLIMRVLIFRIKNIIRT